MTLGKKVVDTNKPGSRLNPYIIEEIVKIEWKSKHGTLWGT